MVLKNTSKRIVTSALALSLIASAGVCGLPVTNQLFSSSIVASAATPSTIAIKDIGFLSTEDMAYDAQYSGSAEQYSGTYFGMPFVVGKAGTISLNMTTTSSKLSLLMVNSSGTVLGSYDFTGKSNETGTITKSLSAGQYYAVIYNRGITATTSFSLKLNSSVVYDITKANITRSYTTDVAIPEYTISYEGKVLKEGTDYKVTDAVTSSTKSADGKATTYSYKLTIQGMGSYTGTKTFDLQNTVSNTNYTDFTKCDFTYVMTNDMPVFTVKYGSNTLVKDKDYTVSITTSDTTKSGTVYRSYVCTLVGKGNYAGSHTVRINNVAIEDESSSKKLIAQCTVIPAFSGSELVSLIVKDGSTTLKEGTDYTKTVALISKETVDGITTYKHEVVLTGIGNYKGTYKVTGTSQKSEKIVLDLSKYSVSDKEYTGSQIRPTITIKGDTGILKEGTDYTISYGENVNIGNLAGTIKITGKGIYTGTTLIRFNIVPANVSSISGSLSSHVYTGKAITPINTVKLSNGKTLNKGNDFTVKYSNNTNVGTAKAVITFKGNYKGTVTKTFKIKARAISDTTISKLKNKYYTGKTVKIAPTIKYNSNTLKSGTDYTLSYKNNTAIGTATVTIKGKGNYTGSVSKTFKICPKKTKIKKLSSPGKGKLKVNYTKQTNITGYQITYSTNNDFKNKSSKLYKTTKLSKTISGLSSGKTYYVKVRTYKTVNGTRYYSGYSSVMYIKVK